MKAPSTKRDIKRRWLQYMLEQYLSQRHLSSPTPSVEIKGFSVTSNEAGLGFNSQLVSLDIEASQREGDVTSNVDYNLKVKFYSEEPGVKEMNRKFQSHQREYTMYSEILRNLNEFQAAACGGEDRFRINYPEFIYGKFTEKECVLVMENIKAKGYDSCDKSKGLGPGQLKAAVDQMAKLHAVSHVYNIKENLLEKYPYFKFIEKNFAFVIPMIEGALDNHIELMRAKGKLDTAKRMNDNKRYIIEKANPCRMHDGNGPICLIHGDYWNNNLMFRRVETSPESQSEVFDCKMLDLGNVVVGRPLYDLLYLLFTSTTFETRRNHMDAVLQQYYNTFTEVTSKLDPTIVNWSYEEYLKEFEMLGPLGIFMGTFIASVSLSKTHPQNLPQEPMLLDSWFLYPVKWVVNGLKIGAAKALMPLMFSKTGQKLVRAMFKKLTKPMLEEVLSGENEILTTRLLDLLCEADEKGYFEDPSAPSVDVQASQ